ncbi:oligosaccharide flippase family protein [Candidatus Absconditicoccus praedator]|uniref:oligosaccharide flippase family protein n=1 Tax=Candidatus Absconditicoccus praedator TaxID=2735562 RepID=UPI001E353417|nr:oligosaccharide flippase family protein [Candidatus Absconditicoccus praedator]UFX83460.1 oligosaccharide flippase family protein [Candidatus Absconditicoccus praedator]
MSYKLVVKDAFWQILGRVLSAVAGLLVIKMITPYLGPLRFGDYSTILKYFAVWAALADFGLYVIALRKLGQIKEESFEKLKTVYGKIVATRFFMIFVVYTLAIFVAYLIPAYTENPYLIWGLPLGMMFSASFMVAGMLQAPLQLYWKMKHLCIGLVLSRSAQLIMLVTVLYILFPGQEFDGSTLSIFVFCLIMASVVLSGIVQIAYVHRVGRKIIPLNLKFDKEFSKDIIFSNRQYGVAYFLSSFHTLVVLIILSIFFPTEQNFAYVGVWALALALMEILLVVPQSLGNALIHKISSKSKKHILKSFGYMIIFTIWIGIVFLINFAVFGTQIIYFVGGEDYLGNGYIGGDVVLAFLGVVLVLSFVKQIFNYVFVINNLQNKLLIINFLGVSIGLIVGLPLILQYNLIGGIITQILLEVLFVLGAIFIAWKNKILPTINRNYYRTVIFIGFVILILGFYLESMIGYAHFLSFIMMVVILNSVLLVLSYFPIKNIMKQIY